MIHNLLVIVVLPSALPCVEGVGNFPALTGSEGACLFRRNAAGYVFRVNARARSVKPGTESARIWLYALLLKVNLYPYREKVSANCV